MSNKNDNMKKKIATGILIGTSITGIASSAVLAANTANVVDDEVNTNVKQSVSISSERSSTRRGKKDEKKIPNKAAKAPKDHLNTQNVSSSYVFKHFGSGHYQKNLRKNEFQDFMLRGYAYPYHGYITNVTDTTFSVYVGLFSVNGRLYYADSNGDLQTGLKKIGEDWYYFGESKGSAYAREGWYIDGETQYYFGEDGKAVTGFKNFDDDDNILIYFDNNGKRVNEIVTTMSGDIYYYPKGSNTPFKGGWKPIGKDMFYFGEDGRAIRGDSLVLGGITYNFDKYGRRTTMWGTVK